MKPVEKADQEEKSDFNYFRDFSSLFMLNGFAEFTLALPPTDNDIRDMILNEPIMKDAISYLEERVISGNNHLKFLLFRYFLNF